jgi:microcystin-dependent protein
MFYLADGSVHVRLTDSGGVVQFDYPSMLVIGPSSGGGGTPPSVDPSTVFQTGDVIWLDGPTFRAGWVRDNGKTISNTGNGGTERSALDCHALFLFLWNTYSDSVCPVVGGRGPNAESDWGSRQITLPDKRGYSPVGDTAMGNADTGRLASAPIVQGNATTPGSKVGEATHSLSTAEIPSHAHPAFINDPGHRHVVPAGGAPGSGGLTISTTGINQNTSIDATGVRVWDGTNFDTTNPTGGNGPHNNTALSVICTCFRKL